MPSQACDICSYPTETNLIKSCSPATLRWAILDGFNPWKAPGIDMNVNAMLLFAADHGLVPDDDRYQLWREGAMADRTGWDLCPACVKAVADFYGDSVGLVSGPVPAPAKIALHRDYGEVFKVALEHAGLGVAAAVGEFEAETASDPDSAEKRFWLGAVCLVAADAEKNAGFLDRAIESFQRALKLDPGRKNSYAKLLGAYLSKGDGDAVRLTAERWAAADPGFPPEARRWLRKWWQFWR